MKESNRIKFIGYVEHEKLFAFYEKTDFLVSGCDFESYGLSIREAMATGLPVIVPDSSGASKYVFNGENGLVYENNSIKSLVGSIIKLSSDVSLISKINYHSNDSIKTWIETTKSLMAAID